MANRLKREMNILEIIIRIYCKGEHGNKDSLCRECEELKNYAFKRVESCKHGGKKPVCGKCTVHCYKPEMRDKIRKVMRKAGPQIAVKHPIISLYHLICSFKFK